MTTHNTEPADKDYERLSSVVDSLEKELRTLQKKTVALRVDVLKVQDKHRTKKILEDLIDKE